MLARAGEPFFTTKDGDGLARGMGLGLFLARVVLERLGGELALDSALGPRDDGHARGAGRRSLRPIRRVDDASPRLRLVRVAS